MPFQIQVQGTVPRGGGRASFSHQVPRKKEMAMADIDSILQPGDALLVVDVQVDFCPGGALPIEEGDA
jgi:hypothetical protein